MALSPRDKKHLDNLVEASAVLTEMGRPELAESVDYVRGPSGAEFTARLRKERTGATWERDTNLQMKVDPKDRDLIKARAEAAGDSLTELVNEGLEAFIAGKFDPRPPARAAFGSGGKVGLNLRPDEDLLTKAEAKCKAMREAGIRIYVSNVGAAYLSRKYRVGAYAPKTGKDKSAG